MARADGRGARSRARALIVQALYQLQLSAPGKSELLAQFRERPEYRRVDRAYFDEALAALVEGRQSLEQRAQEFLDRPVAQLDPVEKGILLLGLYELAERPEVPFRVVINEAVELARQFGAVDGHKYVNAVLDRAASRLRPEGAS